MGEPGTKAPLSLEELDAAVGLRTGRKHVLSILVENRPGVLTRIAGLFARRGFNIETLTVGPTDNDQFSRITLTVDGAVHPIDQVTKQLHKLINVLKIRDLEPAGTVTRELALFKVTAEAQARSEILEFTEIFRGRVVDTTKRSITVEVTGGSEKIDAFEQVVRPYGLIEMMRTGEIAMSRGRAPDLVASRAEATRSPLALPGPQRALLAELLNRAARVARSRGDCVAAVTWRVEQAIDPSAVVLASRAGGEPWMCFEQPERERSAVAALGAIVALEDRGHQRFERTAARWRELVERACLGPAGGPVGGGLIACGGFAFAPDGGGSPHWSPFAPASLLVPQVAIVRRGEEVWCTAAALVREHDDVEARQAESRRAWRACASSRCPCLTPIQPSITPCREQRRLSITRPRSRGRSS